MLTRGQQTNAFYRRYYDAAVYSLIAVLCLLLIMAAVVLYQIFSRPLPSFTAVAPTGERMAMQAYDEPNLLSTTIITWAAKAAVAAYTYDFVNYNQEMQAVRPYFTAAGWAAYQGSLDRLIQSIKQNQLFVNGVVSGPPTISNQGDFPSLGYVWRVKMPFLVTYQSADTTRRQSFMVVLTIVKIPTTINPTAVGIDQFVMV